MKRERRMANNNLNKHQKELIEGSSSRANFEMMDPSTELIERLLKRKGKKEDAMEEHSKRAEKSCPYCGPASVLTMSEEERKITKEHEEMEWPRDYSWEKSLENLLKVIKEGSFKNFVFIYDHEAKVDGEIVYWKYRSIFGERDGRYEDEAAIIMNQMQCLHDRLFSIVAA
jgi:hypothetical protein